MMHPIAPERWKERSSGTGRSLLSLKENLMSGFLLIVLFCSAGFADVRVRDGRMSADIVNQPLKRILESLRQQTNITFYVEDGVVNETIWANFQNLPIALGIKKMLEGTGINHAVVADTKGITAIFLGDSEKPQQASSKNMDNRVVTSFGRQTTILQSPQVVQPARPANYSSREQGKPQAVPQTKQQAPSIPTGGSLSVNSPAVLSSSKTQPAAGTET